MFWLLVIHKNKYLKKGFSLAVQIEITPDETLNSLGWTEGWEALQKCTEISIGWVDILFIASYNLTLIKVSRLKKKSFFVNLTCINRTPVYSKHKSWLLWRFRLDRFYCSTKISCGQTNLPEAQVLKALYFPIKCFEYY